MSRPPPRPNPRVAVTDVVRIVRCEQQTLLDGRFGEARDAAVEQRRQDGVRAHAQFEHQNDRRCYVATAVFGANAPETFRLRRWRDEVLMPHAWGRAIVRTYYRGSPWCLRHLPPGLAIPVRGGLRLWLRHGLHFPMPPSVTTLRIEPGQRDEATNEPNEHLTQRPKP